MLEKKKFLIRTMILISIVLSLLMRILGCTTEEIRELDSLELTQNDFESVTGE